jgi:mono/diheme cytochrome c family protein
VAVITEPGFRSAKAGDAGFYKFPQEQTMKKYVAILAGLALASSVAMAADLTADPVYKTKCAICHGADGAGKAALKTPPLKDAAAKSEAELTDTITKGKPGPPKMPEFGDKLSADQIKTLVSEIKAMK